MNVQQGKAGREGTMASILVVEDSPMQAKAISRILTARRYAVAVAENGVVALDQMRRQRPDLVLSDIVMPLMDGFALCEEIKKDPVWAGVPVILLTTLSEPQDIVRALAVGADDYIMKPCEEGSLLSKIEAALGPPSGQTVRRNGKGLRVRLDGTEFMVQDDSRQILKLLLSTYENAIRQNREITAVSVENKRINKQLAAKVGELEKSQKELQRLNEQLAAKMAELAVSEEKYRTLVDTVPDIVYKVDPDGRFTFLNDSVEKLGYEPTELIGRHFSELMEPSVVETVSLSTCLRAEKDGIREEATAPKLFDERRTGKRKTTGLEVFLISKDHRRLPGFIRSNIEQGIVVEVNSAGMYQDKSSREEKLFLGTVGVIRDISTRKMMEEELRRNRDELEVRVVERTAELWRNYEIQNVMHTMLCLSLRDTPLDELLPSLLGLILSLPWPGIDPCGCIFLLMNDTLVMKAKKELSGKAEKVDERAPQEMCPCEVVKDAACSGEPRFVTPGEDSAAGSEDDRPPHGYYCLPIRTDDRILGVLGMHASSGEGVNATTEATLQTIGRTLAGIILRKEAEQKIKEYAENLERLVAERTGELQRALEETGLAREKIDAILFSVADGLIVIDNSHQVILMNPAAEKLLGVSLDQIINKPIEFAVQIATLRDRLTDVLTEKEIGYEFDFEMPGPGCPGGENLRIMRGKTSSVKDSAGKQVGVVIIISDVTHEREVDRLKTEFLSTAAHELRTPLTSIQGFSEILSSRENLGAEEKKRFLSFINKQAINLANIVNDLLDISRIEAGRCYAINKERCLAAELINGVIPCFKEVSARHAIEVELPERPVEFMADHAKMGQVLRNLLSNAVKYSPDGGSIRLRGEDLGEYFSISVQDQGIGMNPDQVAKIFEKFYRVDASDSAPEGTGLGMTIVKYIVEAHGGEIEVQSKIGRGTTVRLVIPKNSLVHRNRGEIG